MNNRLVSWIPLEQIKNYKTKIKKNFAKDTNSDKLLDTIYDKSLLKDSLKELEKRLSTFTKAFVLKIPGYKPENYGKKEDFKKL